jgi:UDP-GlcNAc:undecaprenyl-phosphate GlcNAc-1-phosphate transferase
MFPFLSFLASLGVGFLMLKVTLRFELLDIPGERSSHNKPMPTMGGLGIVMAFFLGLLILQFSPDQWETPPWLGWFIIGAGLAALVGFIDDLWRLRILLRLLLYGIAAGLVVFGGIRLRALDIPAVGVIEFQILEIPMTILWIIAVVSFYNFMDGIDGLAAGVGVIVTGFLAYIARKVGNSDVFILSLLLGGSCLGFLVHNFPPAKIFMGDVGSIFVGYVLAVLALIGNQSEVSGHIPLLVPVLLLGTFLFDTIATLGRRIIRRKKWYSSHREHYYQKMTNLGFSHLQITLGEYVITSLLGISALLYIRVSQTLAFAILMIWPMLLAGLIITITFIERRSS